MKKRVDYVEKNLFQQFITNSKRPSRVHARHNKSANIVWVDGHVNQQEITFSFAMGGADDPNAVENNIGHVGPEDNSWSDPWNDGIPDSL